MNRKSLVVSFGLVACLAAALSAQAPSSNDKVANPPKGGDAELRGYRGLRRQASRAASRSTPLDRGGPVSF
jgi:hypothetical protein